MAATGLALVAEHLHALRAGMQIAPSGQDRDCCWREPAVIKRVDRLSDTLDLVAAEYPTTTWNMAAE